LQYQQQHNASLQLDSKRFESQLNEKTQEYRHQIKSLHQQVSQLQTEKDLDAKQVQELQVKYEEKAR
jgi:hypothetical protein